MDVGRPLTSPAGELSRMGFSDDVPVPPPPELDEEPPRPVWDKPEDACADAPATYIWS